MAIQRIGGKMLESNLYLGRPILHSKQTYYTLTWAMTEWV
jgi:hypothetical protein